MRSYIWKLTPKNVRETILNRLSVVDRSAINKIMSERTSLPSDFKRYSCIFIHVPKCAGSSIKQALFPARTHGHIPLWYYEKAFPDFFENAYKFCFVRHPLDRAYSAYRYLNSGRNIARDNPAYNLVGRYSNFDSFVQKWLCEENVSRQIHFAPQWHFLCDSLGDVRMDFIGHQETMESDFEEISSRLGVNVKLTESNVSSCKPQSMGFELRTISRIERVYERDYELFGY